MPELIEGALGEVAIAGAIAAAEWCNQHSTELAIAWTLVRVNRENVCPDPYDAQDFVGCESLRALPPEQPAPRVQPWQDWADVFPRYSDGHDGPGGVVTWKRARAADTEGGEA
jgi:hypothetical protein